MRYGRFLLVRSIALPLALVPVIVACARPTAGPSTPGVPIKIVSSLPRTGSSKRQTDSIVNGVKMALAEVNYRVGNLAITYEDLDDATAARGNWDAAKEAENAHKAGADPQAMAYIGTFNSGAAAIAIPILCQSNLTMISPANTHPGLTKPGEGAAGEPEKYYPDCKRNFTRVVPSNDIEGAAAASWAKQIGAQRVYVLDDTELYGHGIATAFVESARKVGLTVVGGPEGIDRNATDYRALAQKLRASSTDLVYFGGTTENNVGKLVQDLKAVMPDVKFMGSEGIYEKAFIEAAGGASEGAYVTFAGVPPSKLTGKGADWYGRYKAQFKIEPESFGAYGYEAARAVLAGIGRVGEADREAIRDAVFATKNFDGVLGTWSFDENGDTTLTDLSGRQVKGGKFDDDNAVILQGS